MSVVVKKTVIVDIKVDWPTLAKKVEEDVMAKLNDDLILWQNDASMRAVFLRDAADGLDICVQLREGDWKQAENILRNMDTAAREWVWDFIEVNSIPGLFDMLSEQHLD
jgi:hypothetical protein